MQYTAARHDDPSARILSFGATQPAPRTSPRTAWNEALEKAHGISSSQLTDGGSPLSSPRGSNSENGDADGPKRKGKAVRVDEDVDEDDQPQSITLDSNELIEMLGLSGACFSDMRSHMNITGMPIGLNLGFIALQCFALQVCILYYMIGEIEMDYELEDAHDRTPAVPAPVLIVALYLHFLNLTRNAPFTVYSAAHLFDVHQVLTDKILAATIFAMDGFIVPLVTLFVGALYLCTSQTVPDVILNSCAVAFISDIDNWILEANAKMNRDAGTVYTFDLRFPVNLKFYKFMNWTMTVVPIFPLGFATGMYYLGVDQLNIDKQPTP